MIGILMKFYDEKSLLKPFFSQANTALLLSSIHDIAPLCNMQNLYAYRKWPVFRPSATILPIMMFFKK